MINRRSFLTIFTALLTGGALLSPVTSFASDFPEGSPKFVSSYEESLKTAQASGKPLVVVFSASWCPPCNQLKATLFNRQDFATLSQHFVAVHVDGDRPGAQRGEPVAAQFGEAGCAMGIHAGVVAVEALGKEKKKRARKLPGDGRQAAYVRAAPCWIRLNARCVVHRHRLKMRHATC
jgi:thiol-disulfide isomerase/thioredoxin